MANIRPAKNASVLALLVAVALAPGNATAGGQEYHAVPVHDPSGAYALPMPAASTWPGGLAGPAYPGCCYTFPIQAVYQCPAAIANQPGSGVIYLRVNLEAGLLGGQPYLYHP